jgi:hypothetical protein
MGKIYLSRFNPSRGLKAIPTAFLSWGHCNAFLHYLLPYPPSRRDFFVFLSSGRLKSRFSFPQHAWAIERLTGYYALCVGWDICDLGQCMCLFGWWVGTFATWNSAYAFLVGGLGHLRPVLFVRCCFCCILPPGLGKKGLNLDGPFLGETRVLVGGCAERGKYIPAIAYSIACFTLASKRRSEEHGAM